MTVFFKRYNPIDLYMEWIIQIISFKIIDGTNYQL